ncbi:unnamed protein product [Trichobilharzia regenti]|nr:unnamed protein product [Trichobilharzia regenti]
MPGSKKGQGVLEASRKVSHVDLSVTCSDVYDAKLDKIDVHVSPFSDSRGFNIPKFESRFFDGNPPAYPQFVKEFVVMLSGVAINDEMKLMYLVRYCSGVALRAIQCCKFMKPNEKYTEAMRVLRRRFGRPSMIVRNVFEAVKGNGSQLRDDSKDFSEFLDNLMTYKNALTPVNYMSDLNSSSVLEVIARRLPTLLQRK